MSQIKPERKRLHLAFAIAALVGGLLLLFSTEFAAVTAPAPDATAETAPGS